MNRGAQLAMDSVPADWTISDRFVAERKLDGHRVMVWITDGVVQFQNRNAQSYGHSVPAAVRKAFSDGSFTSGDWLIDGELVGGQYFAFDLLVMGPKDLRREPWSVRRALLERLFELWSAPDCVRLVATARTPKQKLELYARLQESNAEGLVVKRVDALYRAGKSGTWFKVKFVKTVDARVSELRCEGKDCMALELWNGRAFEFIGRVNMQGKRDFLQGRIHVGDTVEVRYLYAVDPNQPRLVQPEYLRVRTDKAPEQCSLGQLVYTNKGELAS